MILVLVLSGVCFVGGILIIGCGNAYREDGLMIFGIVMTLICAIGLMVSIPMTIDNYNDVNQEKHSCKYEFIVAGDNRHYYTNKDVDLSKLPVVMLDDYYRVDNFPSISLKHYTRPTIIIVNEVNDGDSDLLEYLMNGCD